MNKITQKMNAKNILVSFLVIASVLFLTTAVSAATPVTTTSVITVNDMTVDTAGSVSVLAGDTISVKVVFTAGADASDVKVKATIEGNKADVTAVTSLFDVVSGKTYSKILTLKVPSDLDANDLKDSLPLTVKIWTSDDAVTDYETSNLQLTVQRVSYDLAIKSVMVDNSVSAGQSVPVDVVLKNVGYNNANDVYITVSIPELNLQKSAYLGDLVTQYYKDNTSTSDTDKVTVSGRLYLTIPYDVRAGDYTLLVSASNDEATSTAKQAMTIDNSVSDIAMKSGNDLIVLNPTNQLKVYTVKYNSNEQVVVVPAASSKTVSIDVPTSGDYKFDVSVLSGATLLSTVNFSGSNQNSTVELTNPVFVLTVILAIVFLVLLVVLVVLITKKPQKTEEFGESYY
ncbi:Uncharacterised protein [uncultured archaeon]|nr:Uncharacterised protein [uncultured archaeon]